ncbi:unnamed protein product [Darwinula stevensoni]|uniref:Uncharacterized protein n=1 Tax=Darwinula stevensoni TaxID=69355 RepID=A0A7R9A9C6_9CRUS|nr:unnamed protein product [Darwinula stevensoni]CAG0897275.1 unnamed protein product [Darwinula stevensoni]
MEGFLWFLAVCVAVSGEVEVGVEDYAPGVEMGVEVFVVEPLKERQEGEVIIRILQEFDFQNNSLTLVAEPDEPWRLEVVEPKSIAVHGENVTLKLLPRWLGRTGIRITVTDQMGSIVVEDDVKVTILRQLRLVDQLFLIFFTCVVVVNNVNMGCQLDLSVIKATLKRPIGPAVGFFSQFTVMPLVSYFAGLWFLEDSFSRLGLFVLGCSPGGASSNFFTLLLHGDVDLSITMTTISMIAALGMMPLWLWILAKSLTPEGEYTIQVPYGQLILSLLFLTVPLACGLLIKQKRPKWAAISDRIIRPLTFINIGIYSNLFVLKLMTWNMVLAGAILGVGGFSLGATAARIFRLSAPQIKAVSIEVAMQNVAVAMVVLKLSLPNPDADVGMVPVVVQFLVTGMPLLLLVLVVTIWEWKWGNPSPTSSDQI